jgi:hypothetical protein
MLMSETVVVRPSLLHSLNLRRLSALAVFAGASTIALHAQQVAPQDAQPAAQLVAEAQKPPVDLATTIAGLSYSSSSSDVSTPVDPIAAARLNLAEGAGSGLQPPPRRRYGRPRYNDSSHNPDGSNKFAFMLGAGLTAALGNTYHYLNTNYAFQVGAGRNFNKNFSVMAQFDYDRFGFNGRTIFNEASLYNYYCSLGGQPGCAAGLDGSSHVWSFTLNPTYNFDITPTVGAYVVAGVGFYHKVANFTTPQAVCLDIFCEFQGQENETFDHYTSNAPGFNGGFGLTYKSSRFSTERLYAEARYVFVDNSQRQGVTVADSTTVLNAYNGTNLYPANSNRTTYTAYKLGVRF